MDYIELNVKTSDEQQSEILVAELAEYPFDSFTTESGTLKAYIPHDALPDCKTAVDEMLARYGIHDQKYIAIESQNWNALWEKDFTPVEVDNEVYIRAPFREPRGASRLDVVIMPKMSFGTGHHATTWLMSREAAERDFTDKHVLDMGSGTGVLSIIAVKQGAMAVDAVDIDDWAYENCRENCKANGVEDKVNIILGDVSAISGKHYDTILANINRNILTTDMPAYRDSLNTGGELIMSGILEADIPIIRTRAEQLGLKYLGSRLREGWAAVIVKKAF